MKKDVYEKAKSLQSSIRSIKNRKEKLELFKKKENRNSEPPIIFGYQSTNFITLTDNEVEHLANFLIEKCDNEIKFLEDEFDKL